MDEKRESLEGKLLRDAIQDVGNQVRALKWALTKKGILSEADLAAAKAEWESQRAVESAANPVVREIEDTGRRLEDEQHRIQKEVELEYEAHRVQKELENEFKADTP